MPALIVNGPRPRRILIEITHPAHAHFFRNPIRILCREGHEVTITSRDKDCTIQLLNQMGFSHICISSQRRAGLLGLASELVKRNYALWQVAREIRPDVFAAIGGISAAEIAWLMRKPSVIFYDTEIARLQNALTYPFAGQIIVPRCYQGTVPTRKTLRYGGYHELSYLHPSYFSPNREIAIANGVSETKDTFFVRLVSWTASHDAGIKGWSEGTIDSVVNFLHERGKVIISAEDELPTSLQRFQYTGAEDRVHHVIANCRMYVGESATMASEAVILGVPAVYAATDSRGYIDDQSNRFGMSKVVLDNDRDKILEAMQAALSLPMETFAVRHARLLRETVDVAQLAANQILAASNAS